MFKNFSKHFLYLAHVLQMILAPEEIDCDLCDILAKKKKNGPWHVTAKLVNLAGPCATWLACQNFGFGTS
jgi:hypothetical protein